MIEHYVGVCQHTDIAIDLEGQNLVVGASDLGYVEELIEQRLFHEQCQHDIVRLESTRRRDVQRIMDEVDTGRPLTVMCSVRPPRRLIRAIERRMTVGTVDDDVARRVFGLSTGMAPPSPHGVSIVLDGTLAVGDPVLPNRLLNLSGAVDSVTYAGTSELIVTRALSTAICGPRHETERLRKLLNDQARKEGFDVVDIVMDGDVVPRSGQFDLMSLMSLLNIVFMGGAVEMLVDMYSLMGDGCDKACDRAKDVLNHTMATANTLEIMPMADQIERAIADGIIDHSPIDDLPDHLKVIGQSLWGRSDVPVVDGLPLDVVRVPDNPAVEAIVPAMYGYAYGKIVVNTDSPYIWSFDGGPIFWSRVFAATPCMIVDAEDYDDDVEVAQLFERLPRESDEPIYRWIASTELGAGPNAEVCLRNGATVDGAASHDGSPRTAS